MGAATVQAQLGTGASISLANAEGGTFTWNRVDSLAGTTPVPIPTATGTKYSFFKSLVLAVTAAGTTNMSNRRVNLSGAPATGLTFSFKSLAVASYVQATSGNQIADGGTNGATPAGYTAMTTSAQVYDSSSVATSSTGANGTLCVCVAGLDATYAGGPGSANASPSLVFTYDEA